MNAQERTQNRLMIILISIGVAIVICLGVIAYLMNAGKMRSAAPKYETTTDVATKNGLWVEGWNVLHGTFHFNGADYGFTLRVDYDAANKRLRSAIYAADNSTNNIPINREVYLSPDGTRLTIIGDNTYIQATGSAKTGMYRGSMTRGEHYGTCTIQLR